MPDLETHKTISFQRTGENFEALHKWMDEAYSTLGYNHRIERHSYISDYERFVKDKWGEKGVVEWLFHIALDNLETAYMKSWKAYFGGYRVQEFVFKQAGRGKKDKIECRFKKKETDEGWL